MELVKEQALRTQTLANEIERVRPAWCGPAVSGMT